ncbi:efflux RND transporter periplasmic adaptor subunit [Beijerinckia sp. L45]|uniref:efflux RND transporter periplasmic adaptor subunit n=1 Tax=Beijerinckia sp. L45 TaxID=1641855 RepID=UPI00131DC2AB|nr:efflux RND transporter periplasmic adaptor subunit [Beijerinckia sp. L45]
MSGDFSPPIDADGTVASDRTAATAPRSKRLGRATLGLVVVIGVVLAGRSYLNNQPAPVVAAAPPPPEVTVSAPLRYKVGSWTSFTGQFSAVDRVELRAQVSGYLTEIHFTDGQLVKKGDLLFVIDPRPYEIALQQARAGLQTAEAALDLANQQLARTTELKRSDYASGEALDQRVQQQKGALATIEQAKASVRSAELNLEFTRITAPQSGRISAHRVSLGNLIGGGQSGGATTLLTTIVSLDPIHLDFDMSETDYLAYQRYLQSQHAGKDVDRTIEASLSDEDTWKHKGVLDFVDNELDRSSGTIHARASLPNKDLLIAPGQFARLRLPMSGNTDQLLVPDLAVSSDQSRKVVMTVAPDGTVVPKLVEVGILDGDLRVIKSGLGPNDRVIINGLMRSRPGSKVTPKPGTIAPPPAEG